MADSDPPQPVTLYELVGGTAWFVDLVDRFYDAVALDERLRPLYPEPDLVGAKARLTGFLVQYWGGPTTYSDERGHPRLRMRHGPFAIGGVERDAWFEHMDAAVRSGGLDPDAEAAMLAYFDHAATAMINRPDEAAEVSR